MTRSAPGTRGTSTRAAFGRLAGAAAGAWILASLGSPPPAGAGERQCDPDPPRAEEREGERSKPDQDDNDRHDRRDRRDGEDPFKDLSPEERERVRQAFHEAWNDPAVEAARERMREAGEAYKEALREAMSRVDPELREVMERMMRDRSRRDFRGRDRRPPVFRMDEVPERLRATAEELTEAVAKDPEIGKLMGQLMQAESREERDRIFDVVGDEIRRRVGETEPELVPLILVPDRERFPWRPPGGGGPSPSPRGERPAPEPAPGS